MLDTNRGLFKFIFFSIFTFGIYNLIVMHNISDDINTIASSRDGKHTMNYLWIFFILNWLTLGIATFIWFHKISNRIGEQLIADNSPYSFGAGSFWFWGVLGSIFYIGPFVYYYKLFKAMNIIASNYNNTLSHL